MLDLETHFRTTPIAAPPERTDDEGMPMHLSQGVVAHKLRGRQRLLLPHTNDGTVYVVADGIALVESSFDRDRPQLLSIAFPGDSVIPSMLPPLVKPSIICATRGGIILQHSNEHPGTSDRFAVSELIYNSARASLQGTILANLTSDERVATLLVEFALRRGKPYGAGCIFDMPLARTDVALYLGLNPDTVSRNLSCLKSDGLIKTYGRSSMSCSDLTTLMARSPVADVLKRMLAQRHMPMI